MDRRDSLKTIGFATFSAALFLESCKTGEEKGVGLTNGETGLSWAGGFEDWMSESGRQQGELIRDRELMEMKFFDEHEMKTISVLSDIIIPEDEQSGNATDAEVPEFIEFIVKDKPEFQNPMRGGIRWIDYRMMRRYNRSFVECDEKEQFELIERIAYPEEADAEMKPGAFFFTLMRNLTATGFFTSKIGLEDIGYKGNTPNIWDGVPGEVLKQYGKSYSRKHLDTCVKKEDHNEVFDFDKVYPNGPVINS